LCILSKIVEMKTNPVLREARSSPYINIGASHPEGINKIRGSRDSIDSGNKQNQEDSGSLEKIKAHFTSGSCSSVDLSTLMEFYNDSADPEILSAWKRLYEEQRRAESSSSVDILRNQQKKPHSESVDNLHDEQGSSPNSSRCGSHEVENSLKYSINRSMDVLPILAKDNFRLLEKCCSVELSGKSLFPPSRVLKRSKEMPNIADVDSDD